MVKLNEDAQAELKGLIKELMEDDKNLSDRQAKAAAAEEANAKMLEDNAQLKARLDDLQGKVIKLSTKTAGDVKVLYKGYNVQDSKNFSAMLNKNESDAVAKNIISMLKGETNKLDKAFDGAYAVPSIYSNVLAGLAERNSVALSTMNVMAIDAPVLYLPVKGTRTTTTDAVSPGSANAAATPTLGQVTFTIDKYIGTYVEVLNSQIDDANIDFVNQWLIPSMAEGIGAYIDDEVFNGTNSIFTSSLNDCTAAVTASGTAGIASAVTFSNLNTIYNALSWDRGITNPVWFGPQGTFKDIMGLVGSTNDHPVFLDSLTSSPSKGIFGCPYIVTPAVSNTPANGAFRLYFCDPKHYTIVLRGTMQNLVNPFIKMKENTTQFISSIRCDGNITDAATPANTGAFTGLKRVDA